MTGGQSFINIVGPGGGGVLGYKTGPGFFDDGILFNHGFKDPPGGCRKNGRGRKYRYTYIRHIHIAGKNESDFKKTNAANI